MIRFPLSLRWLMVFALVIFAGSSSAGPLVPPAAPAPTMKTLDEAAPGTPIRQADLPLTISESGHYYLVESLTWTGSGAAITLNAVGVTLDLGGFVIDGVNVGADSTRMGITSNTNRIMIRNGYVRNMGGGGISVVSATISDVMVFNCRSFGIRNFGGTTRHCDVRGIERIVNTTAEVAGIVCGADGVVEDCVVIGVAGRAGAGAIMGVSGSEGSAIRRVKVFNIASPAPNDSAAGVYGIRTNGAGFVEQCHVERIQGGVYAVATVGIHTGSTTLIQGNHVHDVAARLTCVGIEAFSLASVTNNYIGTIGNTDSNAEVIGINLQDRASATGNIIEMFRSTSDFTVTYSGIRTNTLASVDQNVIRLNISPTSVNAAGVRVVTGAARVADNRIHVQMPPSDPTSIGRGIFMMAGTTGGYVGGNISRGPILDSGTNTLGTGNFANQAY